MARQGVEIEGLDVVMRRFQDLEQMVRRQANNDLRDAAGKVSAQVVADRHTLLGGTGIPQEPRIIEGARVKRDRYVAVQVPGVKPRLSGLRRTPAAKAKSLSIAVEWGGLGVGYRGGLVGRNRGRITSRVLRDYQTEIANILRKYGLI